jgi:hypothetical protein
LDWSVVNLKKCSLFQKDMTAIDWRRCPKGSLLVLTDEMYSDRISECFNSSLVFSLILAGFKNFSKLPCCKMLLSFPLTAFFSSDYDGHISDYYLNVSWDLKSF